MDTSLMEKALTNSGFAVVILIFIWRLPTIIAAYNDGKKEVAGVMGEKLKVVTDTMNLLVETFEKTIKSISEEHKDLSENVKGLSIAVKTNQETIMKLFGNTNEIKRQ